MSVFNKDLIDHVVSQLKNRFKVVGLGEASFPLGLIIKRDVGGFTIQTCQKAQAKGILEKFGMTDSRPTTTPAEVGPISTGEELLKRSNGIPAVPK